MFFDYGNVVEAADERWLSLIWSKLLQAEYTQPDQMMRDVDKIRKCAEQYHGKRQSRFRNPGQANNMGRSIHVYIRPGPQLCTSKQVHAHRLYSKLMSL